jgi:methyl-accepting chemotaxis protein
MEKYKAEFFKLEAAVDEGGKSLKTDAQNSATASKVDTFLAAHAALGRDYRAALDPFERSKGKDFKAADRQVKGKDRPPTDAIDSIVADLDNTTHQYQEANRQQRMTMLREMSIAAALVNLGLLAFGIYAARSIANATTGLTSYLAEKADDMCKGCADLTHSLSTQSEDEFAEVARSFNTFTEAVRQIMLRLSGYSEQLASASEELSSGATQSSSAARLQADQTQQIATAMREMSATVQDVSEHSQDAAETSRKAADAARNGGQVVEQILTTMRSIADSSRNVADRIGDLGKSSEQVGKIVAVINDIADQTNLLALNAAIEAARAGEQGRGFAVVADEVRKLAERTTNATKEIAEMIDSIQRETRNAVLAMEQGRREVESGVEKTAASGIVLQELIQLAEKVGDMIARIATAATQQSSTTEHINSSVLQISGSTQEAAASATEAAKACSDLSNLATDLRSMVGRFRLQADGIPSKEPQSASVRGKTRAAAAASSS